MDCLGGDHVVPQRECYVTDYVSFLSAHGLLLYNSCAVTQYKGSGHVVPRVT
jgi:hypothetical protein